MEKGVGVARIHTHLDMTNTAIDTLIWQALELYSVDLLPQFLTDGSTRVRMAAARAIQLKGGDSEFELARGLLRAAKRHDRELGAFILGQLGTPSLPYREQSIPLLNEVLKIDSAACVRASAAAALGHLRAIEVVESLIAAATDRSPEVRAGVASALARFPRSKKTIACLDKLSRDSDEKVRYWAED